MSPSTWCILGYVQCNSQDTNLCSRNSEACDGLSNHKLAWWNADAVREKTSILFPERWTKYLGMWITNGMLVNGGIPCIASPSRDAATRSPEAAELSDDCGPARLKLRISTGERAPWLPTLSALRCATRKESAKRREVKGIDLPPPSYRLGMAWVHSAEPRSCHRRLHRGTPDMKQLFSCRPSMAL